MRIRFVDQASLEFLDTISYYKNQRVELGQRFKAEVERSVRWIAEHIEACKLRPVVIEDLTCVLFPITFPTLQEVRPYGFLPLLM